ncbi:hypothetical protein DXG01_000969 [Tephrocybe rancida]|nr:hypothetical protein DXG01_000969 [Tephrocybe rancida]
MSTLVYIPVDDPESLQHSLPLLHPKLRRWIIDFTSTYNEDEPVELISYIFPIARLSSLLYLEIKAVDLKNPHTSLAVLKELPCLSTIVLPRYSATLAVLSVLSTFPALRDIKTNTSGPLVQDCKNEHPRGPHFSSGAFPLLTSLAVSGCPQHMIYLTANEYFPSYVRSLTVETFCCADLENHSPDATLMLAKKCETISNFVMRDIWEGFAPSFTDLRSFLSEKLTQLKVESYMPLWYGVADLESLISSLPAIESLYLNPTPFHPIDDHDHGSFVLNDITSLLRGCPKLRELGILLDTSEPYDPVPQDIGLTSKLQELHVGSSKLAPLLVDSVANFFARLLPRYCAVTYNANDSGSWDSLSSTLASLRSLMRFTEQRQRLMWTRKAKASV